ncbi:hypothetical protein PSTG_15171 [Puccinia striiformis f. sp. tritici PST-78]|uniref:Uncharacterized protein n=1 Tax=Puccinia striiformis f. sp. tritici PST-78 TaxID=1165861 RepID=A0A0L0UWK8_9BASI|nr:hypothetical protein PSTG_15171 [Puccinia striiformis f. sp. tritici PST-78]
MDPSLFTNDSAVNQRAPAPIPSSAPADMQSVAVEPGTQCASLGGSPTPATAPARATTSKGKKKGLNTRSRMGLHLLYNPRGCTASG